MLFGTSFALVPELSLGSLRLNQRYTFPDDDYNRLRLAV